MAREKYTRIIHTFDSLADSYGGPEGLEEVNRRRLAPLAAKFSGRILDVGCGSGTFMDKYFDPPRHFLVSADFSINMIMVALERMMDEFPGGGFAFVHALAQALPFPDAAFDAVVCINTVHNMPSWKDVEDAVGEMCRVLKPEGKMLLEFRNIDNPERKRITQLYDWPHLPQKAFEYTAMRRLLEKNNVVVDTKIPLFGDRPGRLSLTDAGKSGLLGGRAPRLAVIATKSPAFSSFLGDEKHGD